MSDDWYMPIQPGVWNLDEPVKKPRKRKCYTCDAHFMEADEKKLRCPICSRIGMIRR